MVEIRVGYELIYDCPQPTPMMLVLNIHYTRAADILVPDQLKTDPPVPIAAYRDSFGNWCSRIVAPQRADQDSEHRGRQGLGGAGRRCNFCAAAFDTRFA
jgi:transglutaminase-like putative cysteine protease